MHIPNLCVSCLGKFIYLFLCSIVFLFAFGCENLPEKPDNPPDPSDPNNTRIALFAEPSQDADPTYADSCVVSVRLEILKNTLQSEQKVYFAFQFKNSQAAADERWSPLQQPTVAIKAESTFTKRVTLRINRSDSIIYNRDVVRLVAFVDTKAQQSDFNLTDAFIQSPSIAMALTKPLERPFSNVPNFGTVDDMEISIPQSKILIPTSNNIELVSLSGTGGTPIEEFADRLKGIALLPNRASGLACIPIKRHIRKFDMIGLKKSPDSLRFEQEQPEYVAVTYTGDFAYVTSSQSNKVFIIDSLSKERPVIHDTVDNLPNPSHVATGSVSQRGYVVSSSVPFLYVLAPGFPKPVREISLGSGNLGKKIAVAPDESFAVINVGSNPDDNNASGVLFVDLLANLAAMNTLPLGSDIKDVAISPDQRFIMVTNVEMNGLSGRVAILERDNNTSTRLKSKPQLIQLEREAKNPRLVVMDYRMAYILSCDGDVRCNIISRVRLDLLDISLNKKNMRL